MASSVFVKLWDKVDLDKNGTLSVDELRAASKCLVESGFPMGGIISSILKNADISKRSEVVRSEWDTYVGFLNYPPEILESINLTVDEMVLTDVQTVVEDLQRNIPIGWTIKRESNKVTYENSELGLVVSSAEQTWENNLLREPPEGFLKVPSRSRPGQFSYYSKEFQVRVENVEQAWALYNSPDILEKLDQRSSTCTGATVTRLPGSVGSLDPVPRKRQRSQGSMREDIADVSQSAYFIDHEFPPDASSVGKVQEEDPASRLRISLEQKQRIKWVRAADLVRMTFSEATPMVFERNVAPDAFMQGQVGDCWLLASMAGLAEFPQMVMNLFSSMDVEKGKYVIKLYDLSKDAWEYITIDDTVPCTYEEDWSECQSRTNEQGKEVFMAPYPGFEPPKRWKPLFARLRSEEMWPLLLEKAVAKFCGSSYANIAGGHEAFAYIMFTGFPIVYVFQRLRESEDATYAELNRWERGQSQYDPRIGPKKPSCGYEKLANQPERSDAELFEKLASYDTRNYLMGTSITAYKQPSSILGFFRPDGLVLGHAYSIVSVVKVREAQPDNTIHTWKMILLRNPHGPGTRDRPTEWQGAWSYASEKWSQHPIVAGELSYAPIGDGMFWMQFEDFCAIFDRIHVLAKSMDQPRAEEAFVKRSSSRLGVAIQGLDLQDHRRDYDRMTIHIDPFQNCPKWVSGQGYLGLMKWYAEKGTLGTFLNMNPWMTDQAREANLV